MLDVFDIEIDKFDQLFVARDLHNIVKHGHCDIYFLRHKLRYKKPQEFSPYKLNSYIWKD